MTGSVATYPLILVLTEWQFRMAFCDRTDSISVARELRDAIVLNIPGRVNRTGRGYLATRGPEAVGEGKEPRGRAPLRPPYPASAL
jgi:hypothetical protein